MGNFNNAANAAGACPSGCRTADPQDGANGPTYVVHDVPAPAGPGTVAGTPQTAGKPMGSDGRDANGTPPWTKQ